MSESKFTVITKVIPDPILSKLPTITDAPIISIMEKLDEINNTYSKSFPHWLIIIITVSSTLVANPIHINLVKMK